MLMQKQISQPKIIVTINKNSLRMRLFSSPRTRSISRGKGVVISKHTEQIFRLRLKSP